jgi:hypothetical protein
MGLELLAEGTAAACVREEKAREGGTLVVLILNVGAVLVQQGYLNGYDNFSDRV